MSRFFVSYRRDDAAAEAGRLYDLLTHRFGPDAAFMDVDTVQPGGDYRQVMERHLQECDALLAIVGRRWLDTRDALGRRRLDCPDDLVRFEIEFALARPVTVIPVLVNGAEPPSDNALPDSLKPLSRLQAIRIETPYFRRDSEKLLDALSALGARRLVATGAGWWNRFRLRNRTVSSGANGTVPVQTRIARTAAAAAMVFLAGIFAFARLERAPAEIRLLVSQFGFRLAETRAAIDGISVGRLGVAGVSETWMPGAKPSTQPALLLEAVSPTSRISLSPLVVEKGTWVWFERSDVPDEIRIGLEGPLEFRASVEGQIRVGASESAAYEVGFDAPASVRFKAEPKDAIELTAASIGQQATHLSRAVRIDSISVTGVELVALRDEPVARAVSRVEGGTVEFWAGAGPIRELNRGDRVKVGALQGELKTVTFRDGLFDVRVAGIVQQLEIGSGAESVSAMPTYLEAAWANYRFVLLIVVGVCLLLMAAVATGRPAAVRW